MGPKIAPAWLTMNFGIWLCLIQGVRAPLYT